MSARLSRLMARHSGGSAAPAALVVVLTAVVLTVSGCSGSGGDPEQAEATAPTHVAASNAGGSCHPAVTPGLLPTWARRGFTGEASIRHIIGDNGQIAAVLFGYPYHAPAAKDSANKILWVAKDAEGAARSGPDDHMVIKARLSGTNEVVSRSIAGGPGPSLVDMPKPGCWKFSLSWPGHSDTLDIEYLAG
ncbi:hypothetical protein RKE30_02900 [Streptomyces sp. Li-HN-5-11]|uniref:hypothetical protein n=1 Tax=Streptomyces sp. Li-HN-5-11 TaxID=3075432 RepID=UPI0028AA7BF5|nr:hypothetical protein [Streptomyces sp. Li-HN-5-11]WNM29415.1 hypothetical protein RKE30_02900 [Streptomyces sp. Li-HN-5-11]